MQKVEFYHPREDAGAEQRRGHDEQNFEMGRSDRNDRRHGYPGRLRRREGPQYSDGLPPSTVADYVHAVIEADRTFFTVHVVERLQQKGVLVASENWPAQFLRESSELAEKTGTKVRYRLIGLWPINRQNGPATVFRSVLR